MKQKIEESNFTMENITIGMELKGIEKGERAVVLGKTANSINVQMFKTSKEGINCTGWEELSWFNRKYKQA